MSFSCDVNVLVYASDAASGFHSAAKAFLERSAVAREPFCLTWTTMLAYLRISTHPSIFRSPLTPAEARANVEALAALPHVRLLAIEADFWDSWDRSVGGQVVRGNLVPDAELVTTLVQHGVRRLYTNDSDFRKFTGIECVNPFASPA